MKRHTRPSSLLRLVAPALALLAAAGAFAQSTQPSPSAGQASASPSDTTVPSKPAVVPAESPSVSAPTGGETVILSPFEVTAGKENGYYAANTLAGTRINSNVQDVGASITIVTKQQLTDTAALDINDVFKYESNTEGTFDYTAINSATPTSDVVQGGGLLGVVNGPANATRMRGLGSPNLSVDYFSESGLNGTVRIPLDTYNTDSVEISRGPNSTLFGLGQPSGSVNVNHIQAQFGPDITQLQLRGDSYGGYRSSFDINRVLWKDKLSVRVAVVYNDGAYPQKPSADLVRRIYPTITFQPFKDTVIKMSYEHYRENAQRPNNLTPRDGITPWLQAGSPTWNPNTWTATVNGSPVVVPYSSGENGTAAADFPAGLMSNTNDYSRGIMYISGGQLDLWQVGRLSSTNNPNAQSSNVRVIETGGLIARGDVNGGNLYSVPGVSNQSIYDWTKINAVAEDWEYDNADAYTGSVEQKLAPNLYIRGGWHLENTSNFERNSINVPTVMIDPDTYLPNGQPNPFFNRAFVESSDPSLYNLIEYNNITQAQLTYDLDPTRWGGPRWLSWLGHHRMLGYYEGRDIEDGTFRYREAMLGDSTDVWQTPTSLNYSNGPAIARANYRYYVSGPGANGYQQGYNPPLLYGVNGTFNFNYYNGATGQWVNEPENYGQLAYVSAQTRSEIHSRGLVDQASWLDDRLVVTGGLRNDGYRTRGSNSSVVNPATGYYDNGPVATWGTWTYSSGYTRTVSVVAKPLKWLGITYDHSDSFQPQPPAVDLFDEQLPNTYGHGQDVGFFVNLLGDKLVLSVKDYKTTLLNARTSDTTLGSRVARLEENYSASSSGDPSFGNWANQAAITALGANAPAASLAAYAANLTQYPASFTAAIASGESILGVANQEAKGGELDLTYNPMENWNIKFTGAQTKAINTSIENDLQQYLANRLPVWEAAKDVNGNAYWTSTALTGTSAQSFYTTNIASPLELDQALLGKPNPQVKEYSWSLLSTYRFESGPLRNLSVGGAARWSDKSVIGFGGSAPDPDGIVRSLNVNLPYYDPSRYDFDFWTSYRIKNLWGGAFGMKPVSCLVQLNVQSAFQAGGLRVVGVNPDGTPYNYAIINPRKFVLTTTFDF